MRKTLKLLILLLCCAMVSCFMPVISSAASVNGISVSKTELTADGAFDLIISVPATENADTAFIRAEFDSSAFEVVSWAPNVHNCIYNSGAGFMVLTSANAERSIDLSHGLEISATMHVKRNAASGNYTFTLTEHSFSYVKDNGYDFKEVWNPTATSVSVHVTSNVQTPSVGSEASQPSAYVNNNNNNNNIPAQTTTAANNVKPSDYSVKENEDDTTDKNIDMTATANEAADTDEEILVNEDPDDDFVLTDSDDTVTAPENSSGTAVITMSSSLKGISGTIKLATDPSFFKRNAEVRFSCTSDTEKEASAALKSLGLLKHAYYPFDISLYDVPTNEALKLPADGFIDFTFPVPDALTAAGAKLGVYHINNGTAELLNSTVSTADGKSVISFRAKSFSTYIIADLVGERAEPAASASTGNTAGTSTTGTAPAGTPKNPHTGVTAAITVPALLVGCVLLSRKEIRRKRCKKYIEE